jgi:outer membrane protein assembly factor BamB
MALGDSGVLYLSGGFSKIRAVARRGLGALDTRTQQVTTWNPRPRGPGAVTGVAVGPNESVVYVAGAFSRIGGERRLGIAALDPRTGDATAWKPRGKRPAPRAVSAAPDGSRVYVGSELGPSAFDARSGKFLWRSLHSDPGVLSGSQVVAVSPDGSTVFADGSARRRGYVVGAVRASDGRVLWTRRACCGVDALLVSDDSKTLYVGGQFFMGGNVRRSNLAALDTATGRVKPWNPRPSGYIGLESDQGVYALAATRDTRLLYIGGDFTAMQGKRHVALAAADARTGRVIDWKPRTQGIVNALALTPP